MIEGVKVSVFDYAFTRLHPGSRYLLFLVPFGQSGKYQLYRAGAFEVKGASELKSVVVRDSQHLFGDVVTSPFEDTVDRIRSVAASRSRGR